MHVAYADYTRVTSRSPSEYQLSFYSVNSVVTITAAQPGRNESLVTFSYNKTNYMH
jgi:hypothetical protein